MNAPAPAARARTILERAARDLRSAGLLERDVRRALADVVDVVTRERPRAVPPPAPPGWVPPEVVAMLERQRDDARAERDELARTAVRMIRAADAESAAAAALLASNGRLRSALAVRDDAAPTSTLP